MQAFFLALAMIFLAEMGDKTQLVALCLASRYKAGVVLAGICVATLVVHVFSVMLGAGLGHFIPGNWISLVAGLAFLGFGLWTLQGDTLDDENCGATHARSPFLLVATTFFLAELGDKTMLGTVTLAADHPFIPVWLGSTLGMVLSDGLAILVGLWLGKNLPERLVKIGAAVIFFGFGLSKIISGALTLPHYSWAIAGAVTLGLLAWYLLNARRVRQAALPEWEEPASEEEPVIIG